jgi:hypothetical protein
MSLITFLKHTSSVFNHVNSIASSLVKITPRKVDCSHVIFLSITQVPLNEYFVFYFIDYLEHSFILYKTSN